MRQEQFGNKNLSLQRSSYLEQRILTEIQQLGDLFNREFRNLEQRMEIMEGDLVKIRLRLDRVAMNHRPKNRESSTPVFDS